MAAVLLDLPTAEKPADPNSTPTPSAVTGLLNELRAAGLLSGAGASANVIADVLTSFATLEDTPFAVVLTDLAVQPAVREAPARESLRLASMGAAAIAYTRGHNERVTAQIQRLLTAWTQSDRARVEREDADGITAFTLVDEQSPRWARMHWAAIGDYYVVALGDEAFAAVWRAIRKSAPSLGDDPWIERHREALRLDTAQVAWLIDFRRMHARLDAQDAGRTGSVLGALGLGDADRGMWTVGRSGRAILASSVHATPAGDVFKPIAIECGADARLAAAIPPEAEAYAIIPYPVADFVKRCRSGYLATRSPEVQSLLHTHWSAFASSAGLDLDRDVFARLGDRIVIHTYPKHPLGIGLLVTILFELRCPPAEAQLALDRIMSQCDRWLAGTPSADEAGKEKRRGWLSPRLRRGNDGVWNLQIGLAGPALGVADGWLVLSHSPVAVRECLAKMAAKPPAEHAP